MYTHLSLPGIFYNIVIGSFVFYSHPFSLWKLSMSWQEHVVDEIYLPVVRVGEGFRVWITFSMICIKWPIFYYILPLLNSTTGSEHKLKHIDFWKWFKIQIIAMVILFPWVYIICLWFMMSLLNNALTWWLHKINKQSGNHTLNLEVWASPLLTACIMILFHSFFLDTWMQH